MGSTRRSKQPPSPPQTLRPLRWHVSNSQLLADEDEEEEEEEEEGDEEMLLAVFRSSAAVPFDLMKVIIRHNIPSIETRFFQSPSSFSKFLYYSE